MLPQCKENHLPANISNNYIIDDRSTFGVSQEQQSILQVAILTLCVCVCVYTCMPLAVFQVSKSTS